MTPQLCNYPQSKALKALGYKGKTKHYFKNGVAEESYYEWDKNDHREWLCTRPTVSDAIRFFRLEKGMHGWVEPYHNWHNWKWFYIDSKMSQWGDDKEFKSHDSAENALLNGLIEIAGKG